MKYEGIWHILEMDLWDEDYFNMEVQAYIRIGSNGIGDFQFGLVSGGLDGEVVKTGFHKRPSHRCGMWVVRKGILNFRARLCGRSVGAASSYDELVDLPTRLLQHLNN